MIKKGMFIDAISRGKASTYFLFWSLMLAIGSSANAQRVEIKGPQALQQLFEMVETQTAYHFVVSEDDVDLTQKVEISDGNYDLEILLEKLSAVMHLNFEKVENTIVVTPSKKKSVKGSSQTVKGIITDERTGISLPWANILVGEKTHGVVSDSNGYFSLEASLGHNELTISYIGYHTKKVPLLVNVGHEPYLEIKLEPDVSKLEEVEVKASFEKAKPINPSVYSSGRSFSLDEVSRYSGTLGDPARMVRSYAGVVPERDDRNDIIIRGNSPTGLQWRLDGIEIPNPNHYGGIGLTGNTLTLLNINMLDNSDFLTGAFPAEYGNALAGVFDLKLKKPNPEKHQFRLQTGWSGFEFGAEGPINRTKKSTYMSTYRYSFLDVMDKLGVDFGVLPQFQDFTTKVDLPVSARLTVSFIGLWGISHIDLDDHDLDDEERLSSYGQHLRTGSDITVAGINTRYLIGSRTILNTGVSFLINKVETEIDTFNYDSDVAANSFGETSMESKYSFFSEISHFSSPKNRMKIGLRWDTYAIDYLQESAFESGTYETVLNSLDYLHLLRLYVEDEHKFTSRLKARVGLHSQLLFMNNSFVLEPRLGIQYALTSRQFVSLSYGNHHQMQPRNVYFVRSQTPEGVALTNKDLGFSGAHHLVLGYDYFIRKDWHIKAEAYVQSLYDVPVESSENSVFSMINVGADFYIPLEDSLVNNGRGKNYGVELTLEKFLSRNIYFMLNGSLFQSQYQPGDGVWRNTAFNSNYVCNALGGYEYWVNAKIAVGADFKVTLAGGKPYIPVDEAASVTKGEVVYDYSRAYEVRYDDYFRSDLKFYYRINYRKIYFEYSVDLQNVTNHVNIYSRNFLPRSGVYRTFYHIGFFPMYTFKVLF